MRSVFYIVKRELSSYLRSPIGYIVIAAVLVIDGLLFNAFAVGSGQKKSAEVLENFFFFSSGTTLAASIFIAMRLIAEERQSGTWVLLATSPMRDWQIVLGKFLSGLSFLTLMLALTLYMPALVMLNGKVALGHIATGYLGLWLLGAASLSLCLLCSAMSANQLIAAITGAGVVLTFVLLWLLSRIASPPIENVIAYLSIHDKHFRPFMRGLLSISDVVFYVSLVFLSLTITTRVVEARRWR